MGSTVVPKLRMRDTLEAKGQGSGFVFIQAYGIARLLSRGLLFFIGRNVHDNHWLFLGILSSDKCISMSTCHSFHFSAESFEYLPPIYMYVPSYGGKPHKV